MLGVALLIALATPSLLTTRGMGPLLAPSIATRRGRSRLLYASGGGPADGTPLLAQEEPTQTPPPPPPPPSLVSDARAQLCLFLLLALNTQNQWSRALIFYLVDFGASGADAAQQFMNVALGFDEAAYGLLASLGFAALFAVTSLAAGVATDRLDARVLLGGSGALWSGAMLWQAQATSFADVAGARALTGFAQAFCNPAAFTALGRLFDDSRRATVYGTYASAVYFGGASLFPLRPARAAAARAFYTPAPPRRAQARSPRSRSPSIRASAGATSRGSSASSASRSPPPPPPRCRRCHRRRRARRRRRDDDDDAEAGAAAPADGDAAAALPAQEAVALLLGDASVRWLLLASAFRFMAGYTIGVWVVPFYRGAFPGSIGDEFALLKAGVNGIAGAASATLGGAVVDRLSTSQPKYAQLVPAAGSLLAIPFWAATLTAPSLELSLAFLFGEYLFAECWFGPTIAALQRAAPPAAQGTAQGLFNTLTLVGNLAPAVIGYGLKESSYELPSLLIVAVPVLYAASAAAFYFAADATARAKADAA